MKDITVTRLPGGSYVAYYDKANDNRSGWGKSVKAALADLLKQ